MASQPRGEGGDESVGSGPTSRKPETDGRNARGGARPPEGNIIRPRGFAAPPPDPAEALYYEGLAAYQHRHWNEALEKFSQLKELQPSRPGLDALLDETRWFLQLQAAAPAESAEDAPPARPVHGGETHALARWQRWGLVVLAVLSIAGVILVASPVRFPWQTNTSPEWQALYERGQARLAVGDYEGAQAAFQKMLDISPGDPEAQLGLSRAQRQQTLAQGYAEAEAAIAEEDWARAEQELTSILEVDPNYADARAKAEFVAQRSRLVALYQDGSRLYDLGEWEEALAQFEKVRSLDPTYRTEAVNEFLFVCYLNAGEELLESQGGDVQAVRSAVNHFGSALTIHPRNRVASEARRLGGLYLDGLEALARGERELAHSQLRVLLDEKPDYAGGAALQKMYELTVADGQAALASGDIPQALVYFRAGLGMPVSDNGAARRGEALALAATPTPTRTPTVTPSLTPVPTTWAAVPAGPIAVRSGPHREYPEIGQLAQGATVTVTGRREDGLWLRVCCTAGGQEGWVAAASLQVTGTLASVATFAVEAPTPAATRVIPTATPRLVSCIAGTVRNAAGATPLQRWTIVLQDAAGASVSTRSNWLGEYRFNDLPPGVYTVTEQVQGGWRALSPVSSTVTLAPASACVAVDFWNEVFIVPTEPLR